MNKKLRSRIVVGIVLALLAVFVFFFWQPIVFVIMAFAAMLTLGLFGMLLVVLLYDIGSLVLCSFRDVFDK